jgi:hypothetical protein
MKHALARGSRHIVVAERANRGRNLYVCPVCKQSVFLRSGAQRDPHFAHVAKVGTPECELFVPSQGSQSSNPNTYSNSPLELYVQIYSHDQEMTWGLHLSVPTELPITGWYEVEVGVQRHRVRTSPLADPTLMLSAEVDVPAFHVVTRSESLSSFKTELPYYCPGLNRSRANIFGRVGSDFSKPTPRAISFTPGGDYLLIWHGSVSLEIPKELDPQPISPRNDWNATLVAIPDPISDDLSHWLTNATETHLRSPSPAISVVWPPLVRTEFGQLLEVPPQALLVLALKHGPEAQRNFPQRFFAKAVGYDRVVQIEPASPPLAALDVESSSEISCRWETSNPVDIIIRSDLSVENMIFRSRLSVYFVIVGQDGHRHLANALGADGLATYAAVTSGHAQLLGLAGPPNAVCTLEAFIDDQWTARHRISMLPHPPATPISSFSFEENDLNQLRNCLSSNRYPHRLRFGALGTLILPKPALSATLEQHNVRVLLSRRLHDKLCAYLLQLRHQRSQAIDVKHLNDAELVSCFKKTKPTNHSLATYLSLHRELTAVATSKIKHGID